VRRREFISLLGGASVAWPLAARAQQPAMPVIGFLHAQSPDWYTEALRGFRQGLKETGYIEGETVAIEYRWAENQMDRLPALAAELVHRKVAVIAATGGHPSAIAAKAATTAIPIVFVAGDDPVRLGLVTSLARPGGNLTGINFFAEELAAKRLELLRELVPAATRVAVLVNPTNPDFEFTLRNIEAAARAMRLQIQILNASSSRGINEAFATFVRERPDALLAGTGPPFTGRRVQLVQLAAFHRIPAIYAGRQNAEIGGLMSYGASLTDAYRQAGVYTGRILKGAKPAREAKFTPLPTAV
jgi:putative ABC transport system substrate-binding protein